MAVGTDAIITASLPRLFNLWDILAAGVLSFDSVHVSFKQTVQETGWE